ncbi:MAG: LytTR family DNA-binding domain-containing protein [Leadbetterella sp.]|jgi:DNA-binding LytR/AlgR family response regulator|nr:LytTR family DNA-binding domain-containing protein [Leadbetterella sp.]
MKVVIVEDEKLSAEHLSLLLQRIDKNIQVVQYFDAVKSTTDAFEKGLDADLLFLDIHLADGNSFEIFNNVQIDIPIIFTTAYDNYAIQAFKQNSIDYLLKPISQHDLKFALEKYKKQQQTNNKQLIENITTAYQQLNKPYKSRFLVKSGQTIDTIQTEDIHHFETQESLSFLVTNKGSRYAIDYTLDQLERIVSHKDFFRINRKIILHIKAIEKVSIYFNGRLSIASNLLKGEANIVSRERVNDFKVWLEG